MPECAAEATRAPVVRVDMLEGDRVRSMRMNAAPLCDVCAEQWCGLLSSPRLASTAERLRPVLLSTGMLNASTHDVESLRLEHDPL